MLQESFDVYGVGPATRSRKKISALRITLSNNERSPVFGKAEAQHVDKKQLIFSGKPRVQKVAGVGKVSALVFYDGQDKEVESYMEGEDIDEA